jgi:hypothetical protein
LLTAAPLRTAARDGTTTSALPPAAANVTVAPGFVATAAAPLRTAARDGTTAAALPPAAANVTVAPGFVATAAAPLRGTEPLLLHCRLLLQMSP